jgi:RNA polymerase sigma factor (sigma-70 family)
MNRVLIVDDDPAIVAGLTSYFELEDFETAGAFDCETAEELLQSEHFPIVLADLRLQTEEDGLRLIEAVRQLSPRSRIATLTAYADAATERKVLELGSSMVLRKPIEADELVAIVREMLDDIRHVEAELAAHGIDDVTTVYETASRVLHAIALRRYNIGRDDAEELVQQAWLLYLERKQMIREPRAWLAATVVNLCRRSIQSVCRDRARIAPHVAESALPADDARLVVHQALAKLDDRSRRLCELIGLEGWSYDEVSSELGIPLGSVGPLFIRAKAKLRGAIAAN